jgi:hypothetical protein
MIRRPPDLFPALSVLAAGLALVIHDLVDNSGGQDLLWILMFRILSHLSAFPFVALRNFWVSKMNYKRFTGQKSLLLFVKVISPILMMLNMVGFGVFAGSLRGKIKSPSPTDLFYVGPTYRTVAYEIPVSTCGVRSDGW